MRVKFVEDMKLFETNVEGDEELIIDSSTDDAHAWVKSVIGESSNRPVYSVAVGMSGSRVSHLTRDQVIMVIRDIPNGTPIPLPAPLRLVFQTDRVLHISPLAIDTGSSGACNVGVAFQVFGSNDVRPSKIANT